MILNTASDTRIVQESLVSEWTQTVGEQLICQVELFAVALTRWQLKDILMYRRVLLFVDNDAARGALIKGRSSSRTMDLLRKAFYAADAWDPCFWWIERVPSKSNPADDPSRGAGYESSILWEARLEREFGAQRMLLDWLSTSA